MMKVFRFGFVLIALLAVSLPVLAQVRQQGSEPIAAGATIHWVVAFEHGGATLTVSRPDGIVTREEFAAGEKPSFEATAKDETLPDGSYSWEIVFAPRERRTRGEETATPTDRTARAEERIVSGSFIVTGGVIQLPREVEELGPRASPEELTASPEDQVIPDDLIVDGSLCVGFDCVNNENFGFDTIRLKENNTRIKFEDTSTGTFPSTDWQLTANDSASGGQNRFSIEDVTSAKVPFTVEGGSTTNSIYIDSTGRVGFRTSTPVLDLHVATSNTPGMRLEQTSAGGFTAQTWDIAGNEANFFVRDVTGGSRLPFRIRPGAPTSSIDISGSGNVGIGTASPEAKLHVKGTTLLEGNIRSTGGANVSDSLDVDFPNISTANANLRLFRSTNSSGTLSFQLYKGDGTGALQTYFQSNGDSYLNALVGNVGIGTTAPSSKLHVNGGDIRVSGGNFIDDGVTLNAPDYVFDDSYTLISIGELAEFVRAEKHLPNIPSANDIKKNGLNMSQFQMKLLEKVEELTLYTIAQHEQIDDLKEHKQMLAERLAALEQRLADQK